MNKTLFEKYKAIQEIGTDVAVPYSVWNCFWDQAMKLYITGDQVCLGEDYVSLDTAREAVQWFVEQLGGTVKWKK